MCSLLKISGYKEVRNLLLSFFALCCLGLTSCDRNFFDQPQPVDGENLTAVPEALQGIWRDKDVTIKIDAEGMQTNELDRDSLEKITFHTISDSIHLRTAGKLWVANFKREQGWEIMIIEKNKAGDIFFHYPSIAKLLKRKSVELVEEEKKKFGDFRHFKGNLSAKEIKKLIDPKESGFVVFYPDSTFSEEGR